MSAATEARKVERRQADAERKAAMRAQREQQAKGRKQSGGR